MKKINFLTLLLVVFILSSCSNTLSQSSESAIKPGEKIGDILVEKGNSEDKITYMTFVHCPVTEQTETCEVPIGTKVNVSNSFFASPDSGMTLDEVWASHTYQMTINNQPVNLDAFGYIDVVHPIAGTLRNWNVIVTSDKPGRATVDFTHSLEGESFSATFVVVFTSP